MIFRSFLSNNRELKVLAYKTYVRPILEYSTAVWNPHLLCDINLIESVQRRFTKRLLKSSDLSYDERLRFLNLDRLELRRLHCDVIHAFKVIKLNILPFNYFYSLPPVTSYVTRSNTSHLLYTSKPNTDFKKFNFASRSAKLWNSLPINIRESHSLNSFKQKLESLDLSRLILGRK